MQGLGKYITFYAPGHDEYFVFFFFFQFSYENILYIEEGIDEMLVFKSIWQ